jgi:hypothetical protein
MGSVVTEELVVESQVVGKRILQLRGLLHLDYTSARDAGEIGIGRLWPSRWRRKPRVK